MSGRTAPLRTATPMRALATSARLPARTFPRAIKSSMPPARMTRSAASPEATRFASAPDGPYTICAVWLLAMANRGASSSSAAFIAVVASTRISAAAHSPPARRVAARTTAIRACMGVTLLRAHHDAAHARTRAIQRLLHEARRLHVLGEPLRVVRDRGGPVLGVADRDRDVVVAARQDARSGQQALRRNQHRYHMAEGVGLARGELRHRGLRVLDRDADHGRQGDGSPEVRLLRAARRDQHPHTRTVDLLDARDLRTGWHQIGGLQIEHHGPEIEGRGPVRRDADKGHVELAGAERLDDGERTEHRSRELPRRHSFPPIARCRAGTMLPQYADRTRVEQSRRAAIA